MLLEKSLNQKVQNLKCYKNKKILIKLNPDFVFISSITSAHFQEIEFCLLNNINVIVEGHADERGTREYNLALGERRANSAKDYLMTYGISSDRISVLSYGKERPVDGGSSPLAWSKNRRSVTVKAN